MEFLIIAAVLILVYVAYFALKNTKAVSKVTIETKAEVDKVAETVDSTIETVESDVVTKVDTAESAVETVVTESVTKVKKVRAPRKPKLNVAK